MKVEVVYALPVAADAVSVNLPGRRDGARCRRCLRRIAERRVLDPGRAREQAFGIFGKRVALGYRLAPATASKIYRALAIDPKEARRQRAAR